MAELMQLTVSTRGQEGEKRTPVLYCDIDGTIRWGKDELGRFVNTREDVRVFDGVRELLWGYKDAGWRIVGVSNQGGIALGHMAMSTCVDAMIETQKQTGFAFDRMMWCPHYPGAEDPEMGVCWCRKPQAGMVIEAALEMAEQHKEIYPPHLGLFTGDRLEDVQCAANASVPFLDAAVWRTGEHLRTHLGL
jgi:D-glycero-D-manno-heptose 1,7-bisphosphate phosphatase